MGRKPSDLERKLIDLKIKSEKKPVARAPTDLEIDLERGGIDLERKPVE